MSVKGFFNLISISFALTVFTGSVVHASSIDTCTDCCKDCVPEKGRADSASSSHPKPEPKQINPKQIDPEKIRQMTDQLLQSGGAFLREAAAGVESLANAAANTGQATYQSLRTEVTRHYPKLQESDDPSGPLNAGVCRDGVLAGTGAGLSLLAPLLKVRVEPIQVLEQVKKPGKAQTAFVGKLIEEDEAILREQFKTGNISPDSAFQKLLAQQEKVQENLSRTSKLNQEAKRIENGIQRINRKIQAGTAAEEDVSVRDLSIAELNSIDQQGGKRDLLLAEGRELSGAPLRALEGAAQIERGAKVDAILSDLRLATSESLGPWIQTAIPKAQGRKTAEAMLETSRNQLAGKWFGRIGRGLMIYSVVDLGARCVAAEHGRDPSVSVGTELLKVGVEQTQQAWGGMKYDPMPQAPSTAARQ